MGECVVLCLREAYAYLILLLCLELFQKFVVGGWLRPILVFSLSLDQAEQLKLVKHYILFYFGKRAY